MLPQLPFPCVDPHPPRIALLPLACDSHCHIYGPAARFPYRADRTYDPAETPLERYEAMARALGLSRAVFVQPVVYNHDHSAMLDALRRGGGRYAGVAILPFDAGDDMVDTLHVHGVRGTRFNLVGPSAKSSDRDAMTALTRRVAARGWHIVAHVDTASFSEFGVWLADMTEGLSCPLIIDHMARPNAGLSVDQPGFLLLLAILRRGHVWVKVSAADRMVTGAGDYAMAIPFIRALAETAPERTLWGTDWPHPNIAYMPDDGDIIDLFHAAIDDIALRQAILVDNPARLYDFRERSIP